MTTEYRSEWQAAVRPACGPTTLTLCRFDSACLPAWLETAIVVQPLQGHIHTGIAQHPGEWNREVQMIFSADFLCLACPKPLHMLLIGSNASLLLPFVC